MKKQLLKLVIFDCDGVLLITGRPIARIIIICSPNSLVRPWMKRSLIMFIRTM